MVLEPGVTKALESAVAPAKQAAPRALVRGDDDALRGLLLSVNIVLVVLLSLLGCTLWTEEGEGRFTRGMVQK